jgi:hypothetical protein
MFAGRVFKFEILSHTEGLFTIVRQREASSTQTNNNVRRKGMKNSTFAGLLCFVFVLFLSESSEQTQASVYYDWPAYSPTIAYDYQDEYGTINPPTQVCPDGVTGVAGTYIDGWWCFRWGSNKNSLVTSAAWIPMLQRFNTDFAYITDIMRWPRDSRARNGYYSTVYLYGSGLSTDNEANDVGGGWQSSAGGYPMVLASYIPVSSFNPAYYDGYQTGAMIHEGIHCILSSMPGCYNSCWFNEGGNTWLQGTMEGQRSGNFSSMGWLSAGAAIAPFMPIECYSGWLQDDSFGGPCAQGVDRYNQNGTKLCTWRNLLGGTQYGECFPHAVEVILGPKSIAWLWRNCHYSGRVLQDMAEAPGGLGEMQTRRLIQEYRGRQAFCDFGQWSYAFRQLLNNPSNWHANIHAEVVPNTPIWINCAVWYATCYVATTQNGSVLTPEYRTLPGWSGANQIPLTINPSATEATVTFNPIGANMSCQLVYRDTSGNVHYGVPVSSGACGIPLANVMNNVIVAVICNTNYIYYGESTRTAKYNYTLTIGAGVTGKADIYTKWFDYNPSSYTITASAGAHGTISPSGAVSVNAGSNKTFTFNPNTDYDVNEVILNGLPIGTMNSYTFNNVRGNHTISVTFKKPGSEVKVNVRAEGLTLSEGGGTQKFIISRNSSAGDLEVGFQISGTAIVTEDYTISGEGNTVTIPSGQTSAEVVITPVDDSNSEGDKTIIMELAESENYTLGTQTSAVIYLLDDELKGDLWCDGCVNSIDLSLFVYYWLNEGPDLVPDIYPDEAVDFKDFAVFAKDWLVCDPLRSNIVSPSYWEYFPSLTTYIDIEAEAVSSVGSVTEVIFYANGTEIGRDTNGADGFAYRWDDFGRGQVYDLVTVAFDDNGNVQVSQPIPICTE